MTWRLLKSVLSVLVVATVTVFGMRLAFPLPDKPEGPISTALPPSQTTTLGTAFLTLAEQNPGRSGVYPLADGRDALLARILLAQAAEQSIDVQYYIWQRDTTSWLLLDELRQAAERGVRVRLLLDDNGIPGLDNVLSALNEMPSVEVRIFNPFTLRDPKLVSYLFDFPRLNRRMHNKSMTVDGVSTVIGGRNIGDIYFAYGDGEAYFDLDVLAVGPAAETVSENFDLYWSSPSSYPAEVVLSPSNDGLAELVREAETAKESVLGSDYVAGLASSQLMSRIENRSLDLEWTEVTLVSDNPAKGLGQANGNELLLTRLAGLLGQPEERVDIVSAYLIPGEKGTELIKTWLAGGVTTRLMTNSQEATDVMPVHSAWMKYRDDIVRAGGDVIELRARPDIAPTTSLAQLLGGSLSSLHAKAIAVDNQRIFIGSFNFDPRSASLNTEMGFLIESPRIATAMAHAMDSNNAVYKVEQSEAGDIVWIEDIGNGEVITHSEEPGTTAFERALTRFVSWLPVEWML